MNSLPPTAEARRRLATLTALGLAQSAVYLVLATWSGYHSRPTFVILLALLAFTLYLASLPLSRSLPIAIPIVIAIGIVFRLLLLPNPPFLTDDHFRYLWDGLLQTRGINPYRYAPADPALSGIDDALRAQVNHPNVTTIYPPIAQMVFALVALTSTGYLGLKLIWLTCDAGIAALIYRLVPNERRLHALILYWWSPLVVIEVAWNAHLDLLGVLPLVTALWLARRAPVRSIALGSAIAAAGLVKYFAVALLPAATRIGRPFRTAFAFSVAVAVLYLPYASAGGRLFTGLGTYAGSWRFNDGLYHILNWIAPWPHAAKAVAAAVVLFIVVQSARNEWTIEKAAFWVTGAILMLSPTVHPWYLLWMVPLVAIRPNRAWLYLSGSVFLAYYGLATYRAEGLWLEPWWIKLAIYGPFFILLAVDSWRGSWWQAQWESARFKS